MMEEFLLSLVLYPLLLSCSAEAKVVRGVISSTKAWEEKGQYIAKFGFHDESALFKYETNSTTDGRWYFFLDENWPQALAETDCSTRLSLARFSMAMSSTAGSQHFSQWIRPHFWFLVYADPRTCGRDPPSLNEYIQYIVTFLNPDSSQLATDHLGEERRGLIMFYVLLVLVYIIGILLYASAVRATIRKGGPMHETLKMLSVAMGLHFVSAVLMLLYLWSFSCNGEGYPFLETLSLLLEELGECHMIWMLMGLSVGWTLQSNKDVRDRGQLVINAAVTAIHVILVLWERSYNESHYTYHVHENTPGWMIAVLRLGLTLLFLNNLRCTLEQERSTLRRDFYSTFSVWCCVWFMSFPALMVLTMVMPEYWRHRAMTTGVVVIQTMAMALLSRLFLSRSLYWEVSTLSSTTLPLKRDRGT